MIILTEMTARRDFGVGSVPTVRPKDGCAGIVKKRSRGVGQLRRLPARGLTASNSTFRECEAPAESRHRQGLRAARPEPRPPGTPAPRATVRRAYCAGAAGRSM